MSTALSYPTSRPSLNLDFANSKRLDPRITFTRASVGTYEDSAGVLRTAAVNQARFDHNPVTGESLGLLVEEQRTNLASYSEDTSQWLAPTNITLTQNQTTAPDGALTADQYLETTASGLHVQDGSPFVFVTSTVYTYSVFVKSIGGRNFEIGYPPTIFTNRFARFNLSGSGSVQSSDAGVTASIRAYANGWYRCSATSTCASGATSRMSNFIINDSFTRSYTGDITKGLFIWGAQPEAGAFPTSYIPTGASAVTRSADVASISGSNFSAWYRQDEGTAYLEGSRDTTTGFPYRFSFNDNTNANRIVSYIDARFLNVESIEIITASVVQATVFGGGALSAPVKIALGIASDNVAAAYSGTIAGTDTSVTLPLVSQLNIGAAHNGAPLTGTIRRFTYWPQRLPNATLQALTQ
jgi:hypothetical protein